MTFMLNELSRFGTPTERYVKTGIYKPALTLLRIRCQAVIEEVYF